jgi:hypothetical protein
MGKMKTTIELPDELFKQAKLTALENGMSLKEFFISALKHELLLEKAPKSKELPWKNLLNSGTVDDNLDSYSGFENYSIDNSISYLSVNEPSNK